MSTFMAKAENVERKWYVLDAAGKPLGRTAATAAMLLRGKHKTTFTAAEEFHRPSVRYPSEGICWREPQSSGSEARELGKVRED